MSTTAWRFSDTEGADAAVLRLKQLDTQDLIDVQDVAVIRWPHYAPAPQAQLHRVPLEGPGDRIDRGVHAQLPRTPSPDPAHVSRINHGPGWLIAYAVDT